MDVDALSALLRQKGQMLQLAQQQYAQWQAILGEMRSELGTPATPPFESDGKLSGVSLSAQPCVTDLEETLESLEPWPEAVDLTDQLDEASATASEVEGHIAASDPSPWVRIYSPEPSSPSRKSSTGKELRGLEILSTLSPDSDAFAKMKPKLDHVAGILVLLNMLVMFLELELEGYSSATFIGEERPAVDDIDMWLHALRWLDGFFNVFFLSELVLRIWFSGRAFFCVVSNLLEMALVLSCLLDLVVMMSFVEGTNVNGIPLLALIRALSALRALRTCRLFKGLRLLLRACESFVTSLCWSMVLLCIFMSAGSLVMGNLLQAFIRGDALEEDRRWVWEHFGTAYRAMYTLYELTFAGNWPTKARPVLNNVSHTFVIFFVAYITLVSFAVIRVVTAIFLKDTLEAAQNDAEMQLVGQLRKKAEYVKKLEDFFETFDGSGRGVITESQLTDMMSNPKVRAHFQTLDLDVHEGAALFHILDNGDGEVTLDEFIDGILRCKGPARAVDQVAMQAEMRQLDIKLSKALHMLDPEFSAERVGTVSEHLRAFQPARHNNWTSSQTQSSYTSAEHS